MKVAFDSDDEKVLFDETTVKNLEIFSSSYENNEKYSLYGVINTTKTAGGSRLLRSWLGNPSKNSTVLKNRLRTIEKYSEARELSQHITDLMKNIADIYKITSGILYKKLSVIGFIKLRTLLGFILEDERAVAEIKALGLSDKELSTVQNIYKYLQTTFKAEVTNDNDFVQDGIDARIDELRKVAFHSDELLLQYQQAIVQHTGISAIKVKFITNQ